MPIIITTVEPEEFPSVTLYRFSLPDGTIALETGSDESAGVWHITTPALGLTELPASDLLGLRTFLSDPIIAALLHADTSNELSPITVARDMEIIDEDDQVEGLSLTRYSLGDLSLEVFDIPDRGTGNDLYFEFPHVFDAIPARAQLRLVRAFLNSPEISAIIGGPDPVRPERKGTAQ